MNRLLLLSLSWILLSVSCTAQTHLGFQGLDGDWTIELTEDDIGHVRTQMHFETQDGTFEAYTRMGVDKIILGRFTSFLGRAFTKNFKDGSLLRLEQGLFRKTGDTTRMAAILNAAIGRFNVEGFAWGDSLLLTIRSGTTIKGQLKGTRRLIPLPMESYPALIATAIRTTEANIYNRAVLQQKEWTSFVNQMTQLAPRLQDDLELVFAFFYYTHKLPFSHYALLKPSPDGDPAGDTSRLSRVRLEALDARTGYLAIRSFDGPASEIDSIFSVIRKQGYQNLVVDLRGNPGGSVAAGMAFARHVADSAFYGGIFLTQRYFNTHTKLPSIVDYNRFPAFSEANASLILDGIHQEEGLCLKVVPATQNLFKGRLYLLVDKATASTCEPIVYGLKHQKRATVIGQKTAGAMLNGEFFDVNKGFKLVLPTADYYTADGFRIDQNGVVPDIITQPEDALTYVRTNLLR